MADTNTVHIGENSPERIAYLLMQNVANCERRGLNGSGDNPADRQYILDTYAECIHAVKGHRSI